MKKWTKLSAVSHFIPENRCSHAGQRQGCLHRLHPSFVRPRRIARPGVRFGPHVFDSKKRKVASVCTTASKLSRDKTPYGGSTYQCEAHWQFILSETLECIQLVKTTAAWC